MTVENCININAFPGPGIVQAMEWLFDRDAVDGIFHPVGA